MVGFLAVTLFVGSFALSLYAIAAAIGPNAGRIVDVLFARQPSAAPLAALVQAERRIAVRRWAATPARAQWRAAA